MGSGIATFLQFYHEYRDGLHSYIASANDEDLPPPAWPGLWEEQYPAERVDNPYHRWGINNSDGEALAVWRALAWALTGGRRRFAIPTYYRDEAAALLGLDRAATQLIRWEYQIDVEQSEWSDADKGFVPGRACVPIRPEPDPWQRAHRGFAGLFRLTAFEQLTALDQVVGFDASSEITLFGVTDTPERAGSLAAALNSIDRPTLTELLLPGEVFVDLAMVRDRGIGWTSYFAVQTTEPTDDVDRKAQHYRERFGRYHDQLSTIRTFEDFHVAIEQLLDPPDDSYRQPARYGP